MARSHLPTLEEDRGRRRHSVHSAGTSLWALAFWPSVNADATGCHKEEELRSVLLKLVIHIESFVFRSPGLSGHSRKSQLTGGPPQPFFLCCGWLTTPARGSMWYVCAQATPAWASFVFTALDMAPWTFFPYVGILEFKNRMAPLFGWLPLQYSLFKKKGGGVQVFLRFSYVYSVISYLHPA